MADWTLEEQAELERIVGEIEARARDRVNESEEGSEDGEEDSELAEVEQD